MSEREYRANVWRLLAHTDQGPFEIENRGEFDELVVSPWLHIEQLDAGTWWLRVGDARLEVRIPGEGQPEVDIVRGFHDEERGTTTKHVLPSDPKKPSRR